MPDARTSILFIDDDADIVKTAELLLRQHEFEFIGVPSPAEAYSVLSARSVDVILLDLNFSRIQTSGEEGLACLREIMAHDPHATVLVITGHSGLNIAVQSVRAGARNFIMKPWNNERLLAAIEDALQARKPNDATLADSGLIVGESDAMFRIKQLIGRCAPMTASVLVMGEAGTGKSLIAQALHTQSGRTYMRLVDAMNLATNALSDIEDTTLIVDAIERLDPKQGLTLQTWLQQAAQRNCRLVATTSRGRSELGLDRALLYAVSTVEILLPPLHERGADVGLLASHFARTFARQQGLGTRTLSSEALALLEAQLWADNLHAMRQVVERAVIETSGPTIGIENLTLSDGSDAAGSSADFNLDRTERVMIEAALTRHNFNISHAAAELGLTRPALYRRMAKHGL